MQQVEDNSSCLSAAGWSWMHLMQLVYYGCGKTEMTLDMVFCLKAYFCFWSFLDQASSCSLVCVAKLFPMCLALHKLVAFMPGLH